MSMRKILLAGCVLASLGFASQSHAEGINSAASTALPIGAGSQQFLAVQPSGVTQFGQLQTVGTTTQFQAKASIDSTTGAANFGNQVKVGNTTAACNPSNAGAIRWTGAAFEGCDGAEWASLTGNNNSGNTVSFRGSDGHTYTVPERVACKLADGVEFFAPLGAVSTTSLYIAAGIHYWRGEGGFGGGASYSFPDGVTLGGNGSCSDTIPITRD